jgi:4-alpha-glucanotransferase
MSRRGSGVLLHISSLPSSQGIGDLGPAAYRFVDFLSAARQQYWQILPLNPTSPDHDHSPYKSTSAFAANTLLISPELLVTSGLLREENISSPPRSSPDTVDFSAVAGYKETLFSAACAKFLSSSVVPPGFTAFCRDNAGWLDDFSLFAALKRKHGYLTWNHWPDGLKLREQDALEAAREDLHEAIGREQVLQYLFATQWQSLRGYCAQKGIRILGDMPIYVDYDSADVWTNPALFLLDRDREPVVVAGVPPDYFSRTGQLWKNPLYNWEEHRKTGFAWWLGRLDHALSMVDEVRIDHFRGLVAYWEVPAGAPDATGGKWVPAPAEEFLAEVKKRHPTLPVIAEDLGIITPDVRDIMQRYDLAGMRVLIFAFTDDPRKNPNAPHNIPEHVVLYTGTHDNPPVRGWYGAEATAADRERVARYLGSRVTGEDLPEVLVRLAMISVAETVIIPVQDLLGLGSDARMNTPGTETGNWRWRVREDGITPEITENLRLMTTQYDRV